MKQGADNEELTKMESKPTEEPVTEDLFRQVYLFRAKEVAKCAQFKEELKCSKNTLFNLLPVLVWLPQYSLKNDLVGDVIAGITVAVMHIPHGLAYAVLGGVAPVIGLYMAVFPTLVYVLMGTSRHISLGTFAVLCMMVGKVVNEHSAAPVDLGNSTVPVPDVSDALHDSKFAPEEVAVAVCCVVGLWQLVLGMLRLGSLSVLLSSSLVSGFTTGAAVHVVSYQFKNLLGIPVRNFQGPLKLVYTYIDLARNLPLTNLVTLGLSLSCLFVLFTFNEAIKPRIQKNWKKCKVPVPIELIVIITGILLSYFLELEKNFEVRIVKSVPTGLPFPTVPPVQLFPRLLLDGFIISIVGTSISLSLAAIFAKKSQYHVSGNQELLAYGASNIFGSFFSCLPVAASLSRSLVQHSVGGKTQMATVVSASLIVLILLFIGPVFEPTPYCVLSSIVVATLKGLLMQVTDFPKMNRQSSLDGAVWMGTFLSVVIIDLDYGLGIGIFLAIVCLVLRSQSPKVLNLGQVPETDIFLDVKQYDSAKALPNLRILQILGGLHFANVEHVLNKINKHTSEPTPAALVLNLSAVTFMDPTAVSSLGAMAKELQSASCTLYLTDCVFSVYSSLEQCDFFQQFPRERVLVSVYDAVQYLKSIPKEPELTS